jgi:hypothetical protein
VLLAHHEHWRKCRLRAAQWHCQAVHLAVNGFALMVEAARQLASKDQQAGALQRDLRQQHK